MFRSLKKAKQALQYGSPADIAFNALMWLGLVVNLTGLAVIL